jgi:hypothetical protein
LFGILLRIGLNFNTGNTGLFFIYTHDIALGLGAHGKGASGGNMASVLGPLPLVVNCVTKPKDLMRGSEYFLLFIACLCIHIFIGFTCKMKILHSCH